MFCWVGNVTASAVMPLEQAPDFQLPSAKNNPVSFHQHRNGRPAIIVFWASWCPYCNALMPRIAHLAKDYGEKELPIYALNIWEDGDAESHLSEHGWRFNLLKNAEGIASLYGVRGTPGVFVVGRDGAIRYIRRKGASPHSVETAIRNILEPQFQR